MARGHSGRPSILVNFFAWVLLALILLAGLGAIFTATGTVQQELKFAGLSLKTTSIALLLMVFCSLLLFSLIKFAVKAGVQLFDREVETQLTPVERHRDKLLTASVVLGLVGLAGLILMRFWG